MDTTGHARVRRVRAHSEELKALVLAQCEEAGASVARVAREHGLNANLVHTWRRQHRPAAKLVERPAGAEFVPLALPQPSEVAVSPDIRLEVRRAGMTINVCWPATAAAECAALLREILR